jgi:hypothetical protein
VQNTNRSFVYRTIDNISRLTRHGPAADDLLPSSITIITTLPMMNGLGQPRCDAMMRSSRPSRWRSSGSKRDDSDARPIAVFQYIHLARHGISTLPKQAAARYQDLMSAQ